MEVSVRQHDDGTWYARPYLGRNAVTGKPIRPYKRFPEARDEAEALELAREWAAGLSGAAALGTSTRLADVAKRYVKALADTGAPANTVKSYEGCVRRYLEPTIGSCDADEVRPIDVEELYGGLVGRGLAASTVLQLHWFLCGLFKWAVRREITPFNPMPSVRKPRQERHEAAYLDDGSLAALLGGLRAVLDAPCRDGKALAERSCALACHLALFTGMRCGECCAVSVADCRMAQGMLHVGSTVVEVRGSGPRIQPGAKGGKGRTVSIDEGTASEVARQLDARAAVLPAAVAADRSRALCCDGQGRPMRPSDVSEWFTARRTRLGLPEGITFHSLRHTHATLLVASGADMRTVQERIGHANVSTTLGLYSHAVPGRDRAAAEGFAAIAASVGE